MYGMNPNDPYGQSPHANGHYSPHGSYNDPSQGSYLNPQASGAQLQATFFPHDPSSSQQLSPHYQQPALYQQPSMYQQPSIYQQPSLYQQPPSPHYQQPDSPHSSPQFQPSPSASPHLTSPDPQASPQPLRPSPQQTAVELSQINNPPQNNVPETLRQSSSTPTSDDQVMQVHKNSVAIPNTNTSPWTCSCGTENDGAVQYCQVCAAPKMSAAEAALPPEEPPVPTAKQLDKYADEALVLATKRSPLFRFILSLSVGLSVVEGVLISGLITDPAKSRWIQIGILAASTVLIFEIFRRLSQEFASAISNRYILKALLTPGETQLELSCIVFGWLTLIFLPALAPLRALRGFRILWYLELELPEQTQRFYTIRKLCFQTIAYLEKIGNELFSAATKGSPIIFGFYIFTSYVFATIFVAESRPWLPENNNGTSPDWWIEGTDTAPCADLSSCFLVMMRLSLLDGTGLDFMANVLDSPTSDYGALLIVFVIFTALILLNGLIGILGQAFTADESDGEVDEAADPADAAKEEHKQEADRARREQMQKYQAILDEQAQLIPTLAAQLPALAALPAQMGDAKLAHAERLALADEATQRMIKSRYVQGMLTVSVLCSLAEAVLIGVASAASITTQKILFAIISLCFIVIHVWCGWEVRRLKPEASLPYVIRTVFTPGQVKFEFAAIAFGWLGLFARAIMASLRVFRVVRVIWYFQLEPKPQERFYAVKHAAFLVVQYLDKIGQELFTLRTKGGVVVIGLYFFTVYVFGTIFHSFVDPTWSSQPWWLAGTSTIPCDSLLHCFVTLLRLSMYDGNGFDFMQNMSVSPAPALAALATLFMCLTGILLYNGLIGIFAAAFVADIVEPEPTAEEEQKAKEEYAEHRMRFELSGGRVIFAITHKADQQNNNGTAMHNGEAHKGSTEAVEQLLTLYRLESFVEQQTLLKLGADSFDWFDKCVRTARQDRMVLLAEAIEGLLTVVETILIAFPNTMVVQIIVFVACIALWGFAQFRMLQQAPPGLMWSEKIYGLMGPSETKLQVVGLLCGIFLLPFLPPLAPIRVFRVCRLSWYLQHAPRLPVTLKKLFFLMSTFVQACINEFTRKSKGAIVVLAAYFFITYLFSLHFYFETRGLSTPATFSNPDCDGLFITVPSYWTPSTSCVPCNTRKNCFFTTMRLSLFDGNGFDFLVNTSNASLRGETVLAIVYLVLSSVVLLNGLIGILGSLFSESPVTSFDQDEAESEILCLHTPMAVLMEKQGAVLRSTTKLLDAIFSVPEDPEDAAAAASASSPPAEYSEEHANAVYVRVAGQAKHQKPFSVILMLSFLVSVAEAVLVAYEPVGTMKGVQFALLAVSTVIYFCVIFYLSFLMCTGVHKYSTLHAVRCCASADGAMLEAACLVFGWVTLVLYPPLACFRALRVVRVMTLVSLSDSTRTGRLVRFAGLKRWAYLLVQHFRAVSTELHPSTSKGGLVILGFYFLNAYMFACVFYQFTSEWTTATYAPSYWVGNQLPCDTLTHCYFTLLRLAFYDGDGFDFITNLKNAGYPALTALAIVFMISNAIVLFNGLIAIFGGAFSQPDEQGSVDVVADRPMLLHRLQVGVERLKLDHEEAAAAVTPNP